jgi:hypothetical protein
LAAPGKFVLLGHTLNRLIARLDTIEKVAAFRWKQTQDLYLLAESEMPLDRRGR